MADGYARNYLIPQRLARPATEDNIKSVADEKNHRAEERLRERKRLEAAAAALKDAEAVIASKANELGHLFGSVGPAEITANLAGQGFEVIEDFVRLKEHIKQVGSHTVNIRFADDIIVPVTVTIVAEGIEPSTPDQQQEQKQPEGTENVSQ